ncbi:hypothetical protein D9758_005627 [Tetrapyrgos nigripes]|uniref:Uncharacterized protein n=1 Tax=Tetrapyrgos nigripes TaxID=182062 RepID=A0A8H5GH56_9AGAR|nr:hypothetical protein D9758_005627 [Tetrapyrgos nigripes]
MMSQRERQGSKEMTDVDVNAKDKDDDTMTDSTRKSLEKNLLTSQAPSERGGTAQNTSTDKSTNVTPSDDASPGKQTEETDNNDGPFVFSSLPVSKLSSTMSNSGFEMIDLDVFDLEGVDIFKRPWQIQGFRARDPEIRESDIPPGAGKRAPNAGQLWGVTILDFYHTHRNTGNSYIWAKTSGSRMADYCKKIGDLEFATEEFSWVEEVEADPQWRKWAVLELYDSGVRI